MNVFPIKHGEKFPPLVKNWPALAKPRSEWPDVYGDCNWGVHCEGMVVVDVDVRSGGLDSYEMLDGIVGWEPTYCVETPTGGKHLYYRLPEAHPGVPNSAGKLAPGIDIKSTGGYVLSADSKVQAGMYKVVGEQEIADAPEWLVQQLGVAPPVKEQVKSDIPDAPALVVDQAFDWLKTRPVGDEAFVTACGLRDRGLSANQALGLMVVHDGRDADTLWSKVEHAYTYAKGEAGSKAPDLSAFAVIPQEPRPAQSCMTFEEMAGDTGGKRLYLIKAFLNKASYAVAYGPPGAGKTFVALDIAWHIATGKEWNGRRVKQGAVLYLAYEGMGGLKKRARALSLHHNRPSAPIYFRDATFNLRQESGRQIVLDIIESLPEKPVLIVIDTLARAMMGGDENSAQDMGAFNASVQYLISMTGACVMAIHHSGKNSENGARGSSALLGAIDTEIRIDDRQIEPTKQRDEELCAPIGFELHPVHVGVDEDGDVITSCVVIQGAAKSSRPDKLKGTAQLAAWKVVGEGPPLVDKSEVLEQLKSRGITRSTAYAALDALEAKGYIKIEGEYIERILPA